MTAMPRLAGLLVGLGIGLASVRAQTVQLTLPAQRDTTIYAPNSESNSNGGGAAMGAGCNGLGERRRGLVLFDLSPLPQNAVIVSATLRLTLARAGNADTPRLISLHRVLASWGENQASDAGSGSNSGFGVPAEPGDATWLTRFFGLGPAWATAGGDYAATASATTSVTTEIDAPFLWTGPAVLADVQNWQAAPTTNFGWFLIGDETTARTNRQFHTRESTTAGGTPALLLSYYEQRTIGLEREPGGGYRATFAGVPGNTYTIEYSPGLQPADWKPLGTATADAQGRLYIVDQPPSGTAARFYRAVIP